MNEWVVGRSRTVPVDGFLTCPLCQRAFPLGASVCSVDGAKLRHTSRLETQPTTGSHPSDELPKGTQIAEYVIEACIGRGGMGIVYRAVHPVIRSRVAIKVLTF